LTLKAAEKGKRYSDIPCFVMQMAAKDFDLWWSADFRNHIAYLCDNKSSKNAWVTGRLFTEWLVSLKENGLPKQKRVSTIGSMLCSQQWTYSEACMPVVFTSQHLQLHVTIWLRNHLLHQICIMKVPCALFVTRNQQKCFWSIYEKIEHLRCQT
jgi:hypothetical protein